MARAPRAPNECFTSGAPLSPPLPLTPPLSDGPAEAQAGGASAANELRIRSRLRPRPHPRPRPRLRPRPRASPSALSAALASAAALSARDVPRGKTTFWSCALGPASTRVCKRSRVSTPKSLSGLFRRCTALYSTAQHSGDESGHKSIAKSMTLAPFRSDQCTTSGECKR
jgi:hypothetical protein